VSVMLMLSLWHIPVSLAIWDFWLQGIGPHWVKRMDGWRQ